MGLVFSSFVLIVSVDFQSFSICDELSTSQLFSHGGSSIPMSTRSVSFLEIKLIRFSFKSIMNRFGREADLPQYFVVSFSSFNSLIALSPRSVSFISTLANNDRAYEQWRLAGVSFPLNHKVKAGENTANCNSAAIVS